MATSEYQKLPFAKFNLHLYIYIALIYLAIATLKLYILCHFEFSSLLRTWFSCWIFKSVEKKRKPNQDMFCNSQKYLYLSKALISGCSRVIPLRFHSRKFNNWEKLAICQSAVIDVNYLFPQTQTPVIILDLGHFFNKQRPTYDWETLAKLKPLKRAKLFDKYCGKIPKYLY